jgi:hypothetical protein
MPDSTNFYSSDRVLVIDDERQRTVDLSDFKLELPTVGIFDEPRRCYTVNKQWAKIVTGAVSLLLEIAVWPDAEHEGYSGINQILEFLKGEDCMGYGDIVDIRINDCDLEAFIDEQWVNKGSLLDCITPIQTSLQSQITSNDNDIANLKNADISLQSQITSNDNDIVNLQIDASQQALTINDHENRISILEAAGGGAGGGAVKMKAYSIDIGSNFTNPAVAWIDTTAIIQHNFTLPNALIVFEYRANAAGICQFRIRCGNQNSATLSQISGTTGFSTQSNAYFESIQTGITDVVLQMQRVTSGGSIVAGSFIQIFIIETGSLGFTGGTVTFDDGGYSSYELPNDANQVGIVSSGGNPGDCALAQGLQSADAIIIEIDLGEDVEISSINIDLFSSSLPDSLIMWFVDGQPQTNMQAVGLNNAWGTFAMPLGDFPITGQLIRIQFVAWNTSVADMRVDNIEINV